MFQTNMDQGEGFRSYRVCNFEYNHNLEQVTEALYVPILQNEEIKLHDLKSPVSTVGP